MQSPIPSCWWRDGFSSLESVASKSPGCGIPEPGPSLHGVRVINVLCAASVPAPAEISWVCWRVVTRKSLVASHAITLQGTIKVSGVKGDQASSGCSLTKLLFFYFSCPLSAGCAGSI